jgi:hypothetical protein
MSSKEDRENAARFYLRTLSHFVVDWVESGEVTAGLDPDIVALADLIAEIRARDAAAKPGIELTTTVVLIERLDALRRERDSALTLLREVQPLIGDLDLTDRISNTLKGFT